MVRERIIACFKKALPVALKTSIWFLKIMLPVSFGVMLLSYFNVLPYISSFTGPLFTLLGLPGDAALVFVTSIFTNIYTVIALMANLDFTMREGLILAMMCLISHNYLVETLVQKKTGSSAIAMVILRFVASFGVAAALNWIVPDMPEKMAYRSVEVLGFGKMLLNWVENSLLLSLRVLLVISLLMVVQRLLEEFGVLNWLSSLLRPLMAVLGLPHQVAFLWLVGNTLGLAYGSAVLMDYAVEGRVDRREADLLNWHLAVSHSQLEDPILFSLLGLPLFWLIIPRIVAAVLVVWGRRIWLALKEEKAVLIKV